MEFYKVVARQVPDLKLKLIQARMADTPEYYVKKTMFTALFMALGFCFVLFTFIPEPVVFLAFPVALFFCFLYFVGYVDMRVQKIKKEINKEIVYAGRFLIIEAESGVPLYQAFKNLARNYETIGTYFGDIIERVDLGTSMEDALNETIAVTPSPELRKMLWQILNSIKTGSEISNALNSVFDQVVREQQIMVKEYGRKLNPMAMFYMMIAIIIPSLGTIMLIIMTSFLGFRLTLLVYALIAAFIGFIQFMFLGVIRSTRPPVDF
jgi:flagellar protein FlaJ